ncbi:type II toxin-antitoxin system VapC family toxin [Planctomycetota bacterium]
MILVDSNVLMYAAGAPHANKDSSVALLERIARGTLKACIDTEVLQEVLHRYRSIKRWEEGSQLYLLARRIFSVIQPVTAEVLDIAHDLMTVHPDLVARDAVHAALYKHIRAAALCSFDRDFDTIPSITRVEPTALLD